jgi:hypothetical protein
MISEKSLWRCPPRRQPWNNYDWTSHCANTYLLLGCNLQQESGGSLGVFEVADSLFCWNTKISISTEGLLQDDVQFLDVHGGGHFQEGIEASNVITKYAKVAF